MPTPEPQSKHHRWLSGAPRAQSKPFLLLALIVALAVGGTAFFFGSPGGSPAGSDAPAAGLVAVGIKAPALTATTADGASVALEGKPTWLVFQASWCADCRSEAPDVEAAWRQAKGVGVQVVGVYTGEDEQTVLDYAKRLGSTYAHVPDPGSTVSARFGVRGVPSHVFVDAAGIVQSVRVGVLTPAEMEQEIARISR